MKIVYIKYSSLVAKLELVPSERLVKSVKNVSRGIPKSRELIRSTLATR